MSYHNVVWLVRGSVARGLQRIRLSAHRSTLAQPACCMEVWGRQAKSSFLGDVDQGLQNAASQSKSADVTQEAVESSGKKRACCMHLQRTS